MRPARPHPVFHLALALLVTWPLARDPRRALLGHPDADVWNHAWGPWWWWDSLSRGALPWHTGLLRGPEGGVLWFIDPLLAAMGAPLVPLIGVAGAWNAGILVSVALTSWSASALARALGGGQGTSTLGQMVASVALTASCLVVGALHNGVSESLHLWPLALGLAAGERAIQAPNTRMAARAGLALGGCFWVSPYLGLALGVALATRGTLAALGARRARRALLRGAGLAVLIAAPLAALGVAPLALQLAAPDAIVRRPEGMDELLALHNALDPRSLLLPFRARVSAEEGFMSGAYLGLGALALAVCSRRGAWLAAAAALAALALGPWLSWGGAWVILGGGRVPLPWRALQLLVPVGLTHASRLAAGALVIVSGLAGIAADRLATALGRRARLAWALLPLLLVDGLLASGAPWPLATSEATYPAVYADLPGTDGRGLVLDLPTDAGATMATSRYLYWQTSHNHPIPYAPDARASTASLLDDPGFRALAALCRRRPDEQQATGLDQVEGGALHPERLRDRGVRWIVLHPKLDPSVTPALETTVEVALGPGRRVGDDLYWDLSAGPAAPSP